MSLSNENTIRNESRLGDSASAYLDLLRAGAANWVVFAHLVLLYKIKWLPYQAGGIAVVIFFLLSGFLISQSMIQRQAILAGPKLPGYIADRVARIMTPYIPALFLVALLNLFIVEFKLSRDGLNRGAIAFIGNLLMLQDYPLFQIVNRSGTDTWWRIRPYNSAEPFWTVAIELWIYVAVGVFFFVTFSGERIRKLWFWSLFALSAPVVVWHAAAGGGKSLSLIWLVGAIGGVSLPAINKLQSISKRRNLSYLLFGCSVLALGIHIKKFGFDPYELQTACLIGIIMFAPIIYFQTHRHLPKYAQQLAATAASYSYSLYLIHNTAIVVVLSLSGTEPTALALTASVLLAHAMAIALYWLFERHHKRVAKWLAPRLMISMREISIHSSSETIAPAPNAANEHSGHREKTLADRR